VLKYEDDRTRAGRVINFNAAFANSGKAERLLARSLMTAQPITAQRAQAAYAIAAVAIRRATSFDQL